MKHPCKVQSRPKFVHRVYIDQWSWLCVCGAVTNIIRHSGRGNVFFLKQKMCSIQGGIFCHLPLCEWKRWRWDGGAEWIEAAMLFIQLLDRVCSHLADQSSLPRRAKTNGPEVKGCVLLFMCVPLSLMALNCV